MPYRYFTLVPAPLPYQHQCAATNDLKNTSASALLLPPPPLKGLLVPARVQRQPSDKTAILSAAQTLLSLMPTLSTISVTAILSADKACHGVNDEGPLKENNVSLIDVGIPELADDTSQSTSEHPTLQSKSSFNQDNSLDNSGFLGSTSLALPDDEDFLSPMHCFMRKYCVEVFTNESKSNLETNVGNSRPTYSRRILVGQVGIRCMFCKDEPDSSRGKRAVCFPSSLPNLYHSVETWQRRHSRVCHRIPAWVLRELNQLKSRSRSGAGGRRHYWATSAQRIGLVETAHGLRFSHPPGVTIDVPSSLVPQGQPEKAQVTVISDIIQSVNTPLVKPEERFMVTDYLYVLMEQMEVCYFSEQDRKGTRSKNNHEHPLGFPGMQCRHCGGKAGCGRYFPVTLRALTSANSDRNLWNHLKKCRKCPDGIREQMEELQLKALTIVNRRGSRKRFFTNVWQRIHAMEGCVVGSHI